MSDMKRAPQLDNRHLELVRGLASGELRFYQLPDDLDADLKAEIRRRALEEQAEVSLGHIGSYSLDAQRASTQHCENFIGAAQIPMGVVGPVAVRGQRFDGEVLVPMATTEGALLASINRGCAAIRAAGGARVLVEDVGMTRAPVFETSGIQETQEFKNWVEAHEADIRRIAEGTSRFLRLLDIRTFAFGTTVFLRFRFESGDAMGMNMATIACDRVVSEFIEPSTGVPCRALSGNYCVDKKPASINFQEGRGKRIHAEVLLDAPVLARYLKTNARALERVQYRKNLLGSIAAGAQGFNAHMANVVAAFFLATGQDIAHVVGGSMGITTIEVRDEDTVYASVFLPDIPLGAVGGGTGLETQREALSLLGIQADADRPGEAVIKLGEILGAAILAGELSLMAAFTSRDLASAHERLGRGQDATAAQQSAAAESAGEAAAPELASAAVSTPGKLILAGEHAAVYGRPALVTAVDLRLTARLRELEGKGPNRIELPQLEHEEEVDWSSVVAYSRTARERWTEYQTRPSPRAFARVRGDDPAHVVKVALGEAAAFVGEDIPPRFHLRIDSDLPVGAGFGSSAATAVSVVSAYLDFVGAQAKPEELRKLSLAVEQRQHGQPSGVDNAAVLQGGVIWARRDINGGVQIEPIEPRSRSLGKLRIFSTGTPVEPTGAVVAAVRARIDNDPVRYEDLFDRMERATWGLRQALAREGENPLKIVALLRQYQGCLEELGVVPEPTRELVRQIEDRGGAAKISGAGALSGNGAGSLIVYHPADGEIEGWSFLSELPRIPIRLGAEGARREPPR